MKIVYLISENKEYLWNDYNHFDSLFMEVGAPFPPQEHLNFIKSKNGEKIILISDDEREILGWIGIIPDLNNKTAELAGIQVDEEYRHQGYGSILIKEAQQWLSKKGIYKFVFQTSPLFTANSLLYMKSFGTKYVWNNQCAVPPDNIPWPAVDCVMEWDSSITKNTESNYGEKEIDKTLITWNGFHPEIDEKKFDPSKNLQIMEIPFLSLPIVFDEFKKGNFDITKIPYKVFDWLNNNDYAFLDFYSQENKFFFTFIKDKSYPYK